MDAVLVGRAVHQVVVASTTVGVATDAERRAAEKPDGDSHEQGCDKKEEKGETKRGEEDEGRGQTKEAAKEQGRATVEGGVCERR